MITYDCRLEFNRYKATVFDNMDKIPICLRYDD